MSSPAQFGRLESFSNEAVYRPGVDEFVPFFSDGCILGIAFGDMDDPDIQLPCQSGPFLACGRSGIDTVVFCDVEERLFQKTGNHARIGALTDDCGRSFRMFAAEFECRFTQGIIGSFGSGRAGVRITTFPGFDGSIDIQHFFFMTEFHQGYTGYENGQVDQKVPFFKKRFQYGTVIVFRQTDLPIGNAVVPGDPFMVRIGGDDPDAIWSDR